MPELKAILWDHDGTLVETEHYWIESELALANKFDVEWTDELAMACVGSPMRLSAQRLKDAGVQMEIDPIVEWLVDYVDQLMVEEGIQWLPGVEELFQQCADEGIHCAVVSNAWRKVVERTVSGLPAGTVEFILAGDEMIHAKPHPWPYAHAAERLGVNPEECIAIEDSLAGTLSAEAAGIPVLTVRGVQPVPAGKLRSRVRDLSGITLNHLREIVNGKQLELVEIAE